MRSFLSCGRFQTDNHRFLQLIVESEYGTGNQDTSPAGATYDALTLANLAIVMSYAFALKSHLKTLYQLSEDKCRKFDPAAKKSTIGDKTTFRRLGVPLTLDLEEIPFAVREPRTMGDYFEQCHAVSCNSALSFDTDSR